MASINFLFRSKKNRANLVLRLLYRHLGKDYILGTDSKIQVEKNFWEKDYSSTKIKDTNTLKEQNRIKTKVNELTLFILDEFNKTNIKFIDKEWLQLKVNQFYNPDEYSDSGDKKPLYLTEYFEQYIDLRINNINTRKKLNTTKNKLIVFEEKLKNKILVKDVNLLFFNKLYAYLQSLKYNQNTIIVDFNNIKTICRYASKIINVNEEIFNWSLKKDKTSIIYLNFNEIESISQLKKLQEYLDNARDWLIISCFTGQRVSDFMTFNKSMIRDEKNEHGKKIKLIEFTQKKTNQNIALALHPKVIEILNKRNGEFPRKISDVNYNKYLKIICEKAKITNLVEGSKLDSKTRRKVKKQYKKSELITSHIGRRSFATNFYGTIPTPLIMPATGHTSEKAFLNYIGRSQTDRAKSLANYF